LVFCSSGVALSPLATNSAQHSQQHSWVLSPCKPTPGFCLPPRRFGDKDGNGSDALLQHPLAVLAAPDGKGAQFAAAAAFVPSMEQPHPRFHVPMPLST
jgi:hypothetical protein